MNLTDGLCSCYLQVFCANVDALVAFISQAAICKLTCLEVGGKSRFWFSRFYASFDERSRLVKVILLFLVRLVLRVKARLLEWMVSF